MLFEDSVPAILADLTVEIQRKPAKREIGRKQRNWLGSCSSSASSNTDQVATPPVKGLQAMPSPRRCPRNPREGHGRPLEVPAGGVAAVHARRHVSQAGGSVYALQAQDGR